MALPKRIPALDFIRAMASTHLGEAIGQEACYMLALIALKEDELFYPADGVRELLGEG